jgi:hypothetical protein
MAASERSQHHPLPKTPQFPPCRQCGEAAFRRAHRRHLWERLLSLTSLYPVRCEWCHQRTYRFLDSALPLTDAAQEQPAS